VDAEQSLDHGHAGEGGEGDMPSRAGCGAAAQQDAVALIGIESGEVERRWEIQRVQLDPVFESFAGQPQRRRAKYHETVSKAATQQAQPGAVDMIDEHHHDRSAGGGLPTALVEAGEAGGAALDAPPKSAAQPDVAGPRVTIPGGVPIEGGRHGESR
jgi:hypothetical protein